MRKILSSSFYERDSASVAEDLLGKYLVRMLPNGEVISGMINEVEAYLPYDDPASHGFKGRTARNASLYKSAGTAYVHAMRHHVLLDVVTDARDVPSSVLIRSVIPLQGIERMKKARDKVSIEGLTDGPGKICQAFLITRGFDGVSMTRRASGLFIQDAAVQIPQDHIERSRRIGITKGIDMLLRFTF